MPDRLDFRGKNGKIEESAKKNEQERSLTMEYTKLGKTEIEVSKVCVGCMSFGKAGTMHDWTLDETEKVVKHALETLSSSPRCGRH